IHGRVFHTLALITEWQLRTDQRLDLIIQVGDFGAYPNPSEEVRNEKYVKQDPAQLDFMKLRQADSSVAERLRYIRQEILRHPIYFIRGNHEDFVWLDALLSQSEAQDKASVDPFDLFYYVKDGTVWN